MDGGVADTARANTPISVLLLSWRITVALEPSKQVGSPKERIL